MYIHIGVRLRVARFDEQAMRRPSMVERATSDWLHAFLYSFLRRSPQINMLWLMKDTIPNIALPKWIDDYIYGVLGAKYRRTASDMTVIDWDKSDILNYLGTYFPRSYAESYCIFSDYFKKRTEILEKERISLFDFGCGTGGEIFGFLDALHECQTSINEIEVYAFDGNQHALRLYEDVLEKYQMKSTIVIHNHIIPVEIDDFYDMSVLLKVIPKEFDIVMSFKAICEFVSKQRFEQQNPYMHIAKEFLPRINDDGVMLLVDVSSYNNVSQEWLPMMLDNGITEAGGKIILRNIGYNQKYEICHSRRDKDISKITWRIITK